MKKYLILFLMSTTGIAATTGILPLSGIVPAITSIIVSALSPSSALDLATTQTNLPVANVTEQNNTALGYQVRLSSANAGLLKNGTLGSLAYTAKYNGVAAALTVVPVVITNQGAQTTPINVVKPFTISYTGAAPATLMQGTYADTLTFTIVAN